MFQVSARIGLFETHQLVYRFSRRPPLLSSTNSHSFDRVQPFERLVTDEFDPVPLQVEKAQFFQVRKLSALDPFDSIIAQIDLLNFSGPIKVALSKRSDLVSI